MSDKIRLSIPTPCHEDWNKMTPVEKGNYCGSCQKVVMDFTSMSDAQIIAYFKQGSQSTCGRFYNDQLDRELQSPRKRLPWVRYFFQIAIPAFLFSYRATAQGKPIRLGGISSSMAVDKSVSDTGSAPSPAIISGQVTDVTGMEVPFATVSWKGSSRAVAADANGKYAIERQKNDLILIVSAVGYESANRKIKIDNTSLNIMLTRKEEEFLVGIIISTPPKPVPLLERIFDTVSSAITVFPNPARSGEEITIDWKNGAGEYSWELTDVAGRLVTSGKVSILQKAASFKIELPAAPAGTYVLSFSGKSRKVYTKKIIIQ